MVTLYPLERAWHPHNGIIPSWWMPILILMLIDVMMIAHPFGGVMAPSTLMTSCPRWGCYTYYGILHLMMIYDYFVAGIAWLRDTWNLCLTLSWKYVNCEALYTTLEDDVVLISLTYSHVWILEGIYNGCIAFMEFFTHWWGIFWG